MTRLNPCPDCGREPNINVLDDSVNICCGRCDSSDEYLVMSRSASGAINAWNAATSEQPTKTLRDEFAMAAISGYMATESCLSSESAEWAVTHSYEVADLMLKERSK